MAGEEAGSNMVGLVCPRCRAICYGPDNLKAHMVTCAGGDTNRGGVGGNMVTGGAAGHMGDRRDQRPVPVQSVAPAMRRGGHGLQVRH